MTSNPNIRDRRELDLQLVCQARDNGDERAFSTLMQVYWDQMYVMLFRMTKSPVEADDLTMESFVKAFSSLDKFTPTNSFYTWLFRIAINTGIDFVRRRRLDQTSIEDIRVNTQDGNFEYTFPSNDANPEENLIYQQRKQALLNAMQKLSPLYREMIEMRYFDDLSYEQIAEKINLPLGTVKIRLYRAKNILKTLLQCSCK